MCVSHADEIRYSFALLDNVCSRGTYRTSCNGTANTDVQYVQRDA